MFSQSSTPFGSPTGGFGQANTAPAFGSPAPAAFGAPPAPSFGGFGSPAPAPSGFGGFGAPAPAPSGGLFGAPAPAPAFGAPAPAPGGFGSSFGAPAAPAPSAFGGGTSAFGAPAPAPGGFGGFGAPAPAPGGYSGFGAKPPASGGLFGAPPASTFGAPAQQAPPSTGLFGAPAPAPGGGFGSSSTGGFGAPSTGGFGSTMSTTTNTAPGLFGSAPAPAAGGLFGSPPAGAAPGGGGGTKAAPYQAITRQDGTSSITLHAISAMPAYENKCFEELRFEDYSQGNRGGGAPAPAGGGYGGFGSPAPAPSGGLFGAPAAPAAPSAFGAPAPAAPGGFGGFGSPAPAPSGFGGNSAFGAPAPAPYGAPAAFGAPAPAPGGLFGSAPAPAPGGMFGSPAPAPGGLFGSAPAPYGAPAAPAPFGAPAPSGGLFGSAPAPAPGGLFGSPAPAPGGLFGSNPAPAPGGAFGGGFGGGGFGSPAPAPGGLFGAPAPAPAYGAPAPGGLFGAPPTPGGGMFGAAAPAPLAFGMPAPAPAYGAPQPSLFGAPAQQQMLAAPPVGSVMPPAANEILASQLAALETQRKKIEKSDNFRAKPPQSSAVNAVTLSENEGLSSLTPVRASYPTYRASPRSNAKVRPRGFASPEKATTPSLSRLGTGGKPMAAPDSLAASSVTRLVINPSPKPKMKLLLDASSQSKTADNSPFKPPNWYPSSTPGLTNGHPASAEKATLKTPTVDSRSSQGSPKTPGGSNAAYDYYQQVIGSPDEAAGNASPAKKNAAPKLTKPGYQCTPTIEVLGAMAPEDLAAVPNFSVERPGVGKIEWEGAVDVRGADFDSVIIIEPKSASVYMKEEELDQKPPVGTKLNRSAILTLEGVLPPTDGDAAEEKFARKVEKQTSRMGAELISYDSSLGEWKLRVKHFSRYALSDDDSESEPEVESDFESGERGGRSRVVKKGILKNRLDTPYKPRMNLALDEAEEEEGIPVAVSDVEMTEEFKVLAEAEDVFANMKLTMTNNNVNTSRKVEEDTPFPEEREAEAKPLGGSRYIPSPEDLAAASTMGAICSDIAREAGVKSSSTDFGLRMGRSFRIGWSPNGSFLSLQSGGRLIRRRPTFSEHGAHAVDLLEKHQAHSQKVKVVENCPQFSLPPKSTGNNDLQSALKSYSGVSDESRVNAGGDASISKQAFSLLKCLLDSKEDIGNDHLMVMGNASGNENSEERLVYAVKRWLVDSCSNEVDSEISTAKARNEKYAALLAAVTGGDIEKACTTAQELGHPQLATILASGPDARGDILKEVLAWADSGVSSKIPDELLRIYFLIGGDPKMEEDICRRNYSPFDWRRQLAMRLTYGSANPMQSLDSIIQEYEGNLSRGVAPYPQPLYLSNRSKKEIQCVLYRLLRMKKHEREVSLREVIDPSGITSYVHDFSLSFHLAAAISAMGCSSPLTDVEEQSLVDGYVAQLITQGHWDWAVYASLCLFDTSKANYSEWKRLRAKTLVIQNYWDGLPNAEGCRQLLEGVGVPSEWFEEALALRCSTNGDFYGYLNHMVQVSPETACATLEHILIPNMLFMNKEKLAEAHRLLEVFSGDKSSLASAVFSFFQVYQNILLLEGASRTEIEVAMPALFETCEEVEQVFAAYRLGEEKLQGPPLRLVPHTTSVPMASFLAEALSQISLFKCQLKGLEAGISISNTASQILNLSQPKEFRESGISARENICRWLM